LEWISSLVLTDLQFDLVKISLICALSLERKFDDFTLYFLAFNHDGKELTSEEKTASRFSREGLYFFSFPITFPQILNLIPAQKRRARAHTQPRD
jgi:hypothetical protein